MYVSVAHERVLPEGDLFSHRPLGAAGSSGPVTIQYMHLVAESDGCYSSQLDAGTMGPWALPLPPAVVAHVHYTVPSTDTSMRFFCYKFEKLSLSNRKP